MSSYAAAAKECWCKKTFLLLAQKKSYKRKGHLAGALPFTVLTSALVLANRCPLKKLPAFCAGEAVIHDGLKLQR